MNYKNKCFIICVLIILLSITSISASENITDDIISENNELDIISNLDENTNSLEQKWIEEENSTNSDKLSSTLNESNVVSSANVEILNAEEYDYYVSPNGTGDGKS